MDFSGDAPRPPQHAPDQIFGDSLMRAGLTAGQQYVEQQKSAVISAIGKVVDANRFKSHFQVTHQYVLQKLYLLLFPYTNRNFQRKRLSDGTLAPPMDDVNAPDLYIPCMAYATFILLVGYIVAAWSEAEFTPEILGITASMGMVVGLVEVFIAKLIVFLLTPQPMDFTFFDLMALLGYKFVGITCSCFFLVFGMSYAYHITLAWCSVAQSVYVIRTLKRTWLLQLPPGSMSQQLQRNYFVFGLGVMQGIIMWFIASRTTAIE
eukprot:TRINITY_DN3531_c0_g2_i1.p1 TRINITY_DN3531_c0_g2~~TRINITY_DN3531_c0_g2_i1.p1  ORF type:complete len:263 (-),score=57.01 TRINITY_DN3531_c0_g2_i1:616-1404(-)